MKRKGGKIKLLSGHEGEDQAKVMQEALEQEFRSAVKKGKKEALKKSGNIAQANDYSESNARGATFWISLEDFSKYFYIMTICFAQHKYVQNFIQD